MPKTRGCWLWGPPSMGPFFSSSFCEVCAFIAVLKISAVVVAAVVVESGKMLFYHHTSGWHFEKGGRLKRICNGTMPPFFFEHTCPPKNPRVLLFPHATGDFLLLLKTPLFSHTHFLLSKAISSRERKPHKSIAAAPCRKYNIIARPPSPICIRIGLFLRV